LPGHLYTALGRLAHLAQGLEPSDLLAVALREASTLVGAELLVLRLPDSHSDHLEIRWPTNSVWPPARTVRGWHAAVMKHSKPVRISARTVARRVARRAVLKQGMAVPVFTLSGEAGVLVAFSAGRSPLSRGDCSALSLFVQCALARIESARMRAQTEVLTSTEVHDRLAREIHDGPLQLLSGLLLHLRLAGRSADAHSRDALSKLDAEMRQAVAQMRGLIRRLRVAHPEASLEERVRSALARLQQARGISWTLRWREPEGRLSIVAADEMFHVVNEALANVYRHSQAKHVSVVGRAHGEIFEVVVRDDGVGLNVAEALRRDIRSLSFGLVSMQERMHALGGTLTLRSQSGRGTRVALNVPLSRPAMGKSP
jgi:signal transduction histidine kinase